MFVCIQIDPKKSFTATFVQLGLLETHSYVLGRDRKSGHICHFSYVLGSCTKKAKNKPKYSNILHVLEVSTIFLHQTHKVG